MKGDTQMSTNKTFNKVQLDVKFTQAATRANLISEENISISFGKISKYFADLHSQAFTGYTHPSHTAHSSGLYKITVDGLGHVSAATAATKADIPALDYLPNTTKYALSDSVGGSAKTADKLTTARTIAIGTGVTSTATSFDGSANITIPITGIKEAYLTWGGKDFSSSFSPLDAALEPRLGANRLEMCPGSGIKIERTTDGGTTWTEVPTSSISNAQRSTLFSSSSGYSVPVSATSTAGMGTDAAKYMMRITLDTSVANVYTSLLKFILNISTNGCANCYVKLRIRTAANVTAGNDTWLTWDKTNKTWSSSPTEANTKCSIGGWSGYNVINFASFTTYGNNTSQYRNVQFIFGCSKNDSTSSGLSIINIQGYGGVGWNTPSNMARTGHLYSWNGTGAATFPSTVTATNFNGKLNTMTISGTNDGSYNLNNFLVTNDITAGDTNGQIKVKTTNLTIYTHPSHTAKTSGLYKITVDSTGHVSGTASVSPSDIPDLNYVPNTQAGVNAAINLLSTGSSVPSLADYYVSQFASGGTTTTTYHRRPISALWNAFKGLITLTTTGSGNAVTAVSIANDGDNNRKITVTKGSTFSLSTHNHDSDYVKTFLSTNYDINQPGYYAVMVNKNNDNPDIDLPTSGQWWHVLSMSWAGTSSDVNTWISQLAIPTYTSKLRGLYWRTNSAANTELSADDWKRVYCEEKLTPSTTTKTRNILNLWGNTVGNNASELISGTAGVLSYGDAGPQINFSSGATIGNYQDSAIIWTDHDTAASGASWHFVSNQSDWNVISKRFHARTGISIGTDLPQTSYNLYVNGTTFHSDNITFGTASNIVVGSAINIYTRATSTYSSIVKWSNGDTWGTRGAEIGYHNTGGDSTNPGTICVLPYQTEANPWDGQVGLFIKKDHVYIDGVELSKSGHTHSYIPMSGSTDVTGNIKIAKASGDVGFYAKRSDTGVEVWMGVGAGGTNHGIYSNKLGKWMMYGDATNVYLNGNATTASSWETSRTLTLGGQLTGSVSVKGDTNMTLSGYLKNTLIYDDTSDFASYAWHKFAEVTIAAANSDQTITFIVSKTWGQVPGFSGILTAHIRTGSTRIYESSQSQFQWTLAGSSINPDDFVLVYTNTANTSCKVELWYKQNARYDGWVFTILKEHGRSNIHSVWTVYTDSGHGSATYTVGTGTVTSTIADIKNEAPNSDVLQSNTATGNYRPVMFGATNTATIADLSATITGQAYVSSQMFAKPSTGYMYATCFSTASYIDGTGAQIGSKGLYFKSVGEENTGTKYSYSRYAVRTYPGKLSSSDGMLLEICSGGLTIVGGGESATSLAALIDDDQTVTSPARLNVGGTLNTSLTGSSENLILSSDQYIYFITKCNTIANRMPVVLDNNSYFYPGTNKTGSIGTSSYMWNTVYAATIYENGSSLGSKYGLNNQIYALSLTSDTATFNGIETLITSLPSSSGTSTPSYQRITLNSFIKNVIGDLKEPVLYSNTTNPTASATVSFNASLGTPKYLKLFITVIGGNTYSPSSGVTNVVDIDPLQYSNGCFVGHGSPGQSGVSTYLTYICIIHSETSGQHTYSCVKSGSLQLYAGNTPSSITATVYVTKVIAVY